MPGRNPDLDENPQGPAVPASVSNQGGMAPQATSTIGIPAPPPQNVTATGNSSATTVLNPYGPRNDLLQGGIVMDLPAVCYSQFIDIPNQLEVSDNTVPWTIIAQLPYDPTSVYMNAYCRAYALQHERYNGDIMYRIEVIGNASYSGTLIVAWVPERIKSSIANPSDLQTYSYKTMDTTLPSVEQFVLKDARQRDYYRTHNETLDERPHLVIAVHTSIVSPLRTGITVRIRIATRFASRLDSALYGAQPFFLSKPVAISLGPSPSSSIFNGRALGDIFPHMYLQGADYRMCVDGTATASSAGRNLVPGRRFRTFKSDFPTLDSQRDSSASVVGCQDNIIIFCCTDYGQVGLNKIVIDTNFNFPDKGLNDITEYLASSTSYISPVTVHAQKASVEWASGKILQQVDIVNGSGRATLWVYQGAADQKSIKLPRDDSGHYTLPYSAVIGTIISDPSSIKGLPLNWRHLTISSEPVTSVPQTEVAPTAYNDSIILRLLNQEAAKVASDAILQFELEDPESRQRVATIRWSEDRGALVIATSDNTRYALYPSDVRNLIVANWTAVPRSSGFLNTVVSQWASRSPASTTGWTLPNAAKAADVGMTMFEGKLYPTKDFIAAKSIAEQVLSLSPHEQRDLGAKLQQRVKTSMKQALNSSFSSRFFQNKKSTFSSTSKYQGWTSPNSSKKTDTNNSKVYYMRSSLEEDARLEERRNQREPLDLSTHNRYSQNRKKSTGEVEPQYKGWVSRNAAILAEFGELAGAESLATFGESEALTGATESLARMHPEDFANISQNFQRAHPQDRLS